MDNMQLFFELTLILLAVKVFGDLSVRLGQPSVLGKLLVGIIIGPAVFGFIHHSETMESFSEIGVLMLMFFAGLETDIADLNKNRNASVATAIGGIVFPLLGGYAAGLSLFGMDQSHSIFLGLLLSATSVSISVQTLKELGHLNSRESTTILGAALVDDIVVVIMLAVMLSMVTAEEISIGLVIGKKIMFFITIILVGWKLVPIFMKKLAHLKITQPIMSIGLVVCFSFAYLAEALGIAGIIGAFAAGIAISQTSFRKQVEHSLEPLAYTIFVPIFFVNIGLSVTFTGFGEHILFIVIMSIIAIFTKLVGAGLGARLTGFNFHSSLVIGAGMVSRGEVALILAKMGLGNGLLPEEYYTAFIIVIIASTVATPPLLKYLLKDKEMAVAK